MDGKKRNSMEIWEIFDKAFSGCMDQKIIIYGIGEQTGHIIERLRQYHIVGVLDGIKKDGTIYGVPILDETSLSKKQADLVVIVARSSNIGIILKRIARICRNSGIRVFDIQGNDLLNRNIQKEQQLVLLPDREALLQKIREADVVSFDIFDTLIMRKTLFSTDTHELMKNYDERVPEDFPENRIRCERELMREESSPSIRMIYDELKKVYGWTDLQTEYYCNLEYDTDCRCMVLRDDIYVIYQECCKRKKKIYLITDMYYTKRQICKLLQRFHIRQYEDVLVSCEEKTSKSERLFDLYLEREPKGRKLHIGDETEADILPARARGMEAYPVLSARRMLELSCYHELETLAESLPEKIVVGCFLAKIFNSPFEMSGQRGIIKEKRDYGYLFLGALVLKFCLWMMERAGGEQIHTILFSSRDGYLVKIAYEYLKNHCFQKEKLPESVYLYASRAAYVSMSLYCEMDIKFAYELAYDGTPREMLRERFKLSEDEIEEYDPEKYQDGWDYIRKHSDRILAKSAFYRAHFLKYISANHITFEENDAYFDFVSSGTCQRCLQKVIGKPLKGYYFSYIENKYTCDLDVDELFHNQFGCVNDSFLCNHYLFLENIFTSCEPTVKEFDDKGNIVFMRENRTEIQLEELVKIQEGIMEFIRDAAEILNNRMEGILKAELPDKMFEYVLEKNTKYLVGMEVNGVLTDEFCRRTLEADAILGNINF